MLEHLSYLQNTQKAVRYHGKEMKIKLPIIVDNTTYNYEFTFKIVSVRQRHQVVHFSNC